MALAVALPVAAACTFAAPATAKPAQVTEAPDAATAAAAARSTGRPVEIAGLRSETAQVFANPSGTRTLEQYLRPVRARKGTGWVPIDTTLARETDGSITPRATVVGLRLSGGGTGPLVTASLDGKELSLSWPGPLPAPELSGDTATYRQVLPGVDLRVRVDSAGFAPELVVRDAEAAANPVLRGFRFGTRARGLAVRSEADRETAVDDRGQVVFTGGALVRSGPATTQYPMSLGTSYDAPQYLYTLVNEKAPTTSYWDNDYYRKSLRVGYQDYDGASRFRSLFQMRTGQLIGTTVLTANLTMTLDHSASCGPTPVELWHTRDIDSSKALTWKNSVPGYWIEQLWTGKGNANEAGGCGKAQPDMPMSFASPKLLEVVQATADRADETLTFGLRAQNELYETQWKKFFPNTVHLVVEYNTQPRVPTRFSTVPPTPCGTATAPTALNTATPTFSAVASDPDGNNVRGELDIQRGDTVITTLQAPTVGSGTAFSWPPVPAGTLPEDQPGTVFGYRSRLIDTTGTPGSYTEPCFFTVDRIRPGVPAVSSTDFPDGTAVRSVGETGYVSFTAAGGDGDVAAFTYGFSPDAPLRITADQQGRATVPITLWPDDTSRVRQELYVRAVDRAGNLSPAAPLWEVTAKNRSVTTRPVRGDINGDRRADVTQVFDEGNGRTAVWNFVSRDGGFANGYTAWDTGVNGGFPAASTKAVQGDFTGDGRADVAIFREDPGQKVGLYLLTSDGTQFVAGSGPVWTGENKYRLSAMQAVAGDFDGDGDDDIAVFHGYPGEQTKLWVHTSDRGRFAEPVLHWDSGVGKADIRQTSVVAGDFDGDGDGDLGVFRGYADDQTKLWIHTSNRGQFGTPVQQWDSGLSSFDRGRARFLAADVDGDAAGRSEIVAVYDNGDASVQLITFAPAGGAWTGTAWWTSGDQGSFDLGRAVLAAGDVTADGRADIAALYDTGDGQRALYTLASTGKSFADKQVGWTGWTGDVRPEVYVESGRKYRLVARHSDKCLEVPADKTGQQAAPLQQWDCAATAKHQTFLVERIGASPYFTLRNAASGMCAEVQSWSHEDKAAVVQYPCGNAGVPKADQQFRLNYVEGVGLDLVVEARAAHSGKCMDVTGVSQDNAARVVQWRCGVTPKINETYYLRPEL